MEQAGFDRVEVHNLTAGVVALHLGTGLLNAGRTPANRRMPEEDREDIAGHNRPRRAAPSTAVLGADIADAKRLGGGRSFGAQRQSVAPHAPAAPHRRARGAASQPVMPAQPGAAAGQGRRPRRRGTVGHVALAGPDRRPRRRPRPRRAAVAFRPVRRLRQHPAARRCWSSASSSSCACSSPGAAPREAADAVRRRQRPRRRSRRLRDAARAQDRRATARSNRSMSPRAGRTAAGAVRPAAAAGLRRRRRSSSRRSCSSASCRRPTTRGDRKALADVMTPEMLRRNRPRPRRARRARPTEVVTLDAEVLEVTTEGGSHWASVRFTGMLREDGAVLPTPFDEIWNLTKPVDGSPGWLLAGIQQIDRLTRPRAVAAAAARRALANRILEREAWARERLAAHAGRSLRRSPSGRSPPRFRIDATRPARRPPTRAARGRPHAVALAARGADVPVRPRALGRVRRRRGRRGARRRRCSDLALTLPWFVEQAFAKALGPVVGQRVADAGRRLLAFPEYVDASASARASASYARDEAALLARGDEARRLARAAALATDARRAARRAWRRSRRRRRRDPNGTSAASTRCGPARHECGSRRHGGQAATRE